MDWLNLHISLLRSPEFIGSEPVDRSTWIMLLTYCATQENGGIIRSCAAWKDRKWQQLAAVTLAEVRRESELWIWEGDDLHVLHYPLAKEQEIQTKRNFARENGRKGGRPTKPKSADPETNVGFSQEPMSEPMSEPTLEPMSVSHAKPSLVHSAKAEGEGEGERKEKGKEAKSAHAALLEQIRLAYPRRTHMRDALAQIEAAVRRHGDAMAILAGTQAIATAVAGWTDYERLQFLKAPPDFFAGDHWQDDPSFWASKASARLVNGNGHRATKVDTGHRHPAAIVSVSGPGEPLGRLSADPVLEF